jgi:hypothetical protein
MAVYTVIVCIVAQVYTTRTVFLCGDAMEPDIASQLKRRAGDIESNPGPDACEVCTQVFTGKHRPARCSQCSKQVYRSKRECTGLTRWQIEKILNEGQLFICRTCKGEKPHKEKTNWNEGVTPTKCAHAKCGGKLYARKDYLDCKHCPRQWHKMERCIGMTRKQVELLDRANWKCLPCQEAEADSAEGNEPPDTTGTYRKSRETLACKLKILQYNIDSLRTNQEELRVFLQKHKVDVFALQETKLIAGDDDPKIPGYTLVQKDRKQKPDNESNRGGGLLMGVRNNIPFNPTELNILTDDNDVTDHRDSPSKQSEGQTHERVRATSQIDDRSQEIGLLWRRKLAA